MAILLKRNLSRFNNTTVLNVKDLYTNKKLNFSKCSSYNGEILNGLMDWDCTHLNELGYSIITRKSVLSLSMYHYCGRKVGTKNNGPAAKKTSAYTGQAAS